VIWRRIVTRWTATPGRDITTAMLATRGFVAIDVETTGLDPGRDALVAIAAVPFLGGGPAPGFVTLVNPGRAIPSASTAIHGITDADVAGAPRAADALPRFDGVCAGHVLVGHDVGFDLAVLAVARGAPATAIALDTRRLARAVGARGDDTRLESVAARFDIPVTGRHTADGDARIAGCVFLALLPALERRGARTVADLLRLQRAASPYD